MLQNYFTSAVRNLKHSNAYALIKVLALSLVIVGAIFIFILARKEAEKPPDLVVRNSSGMQLMVAEENTQPTLRIVLPSHPASDHTIEILFPEHVTVRKHERELIEK
jgi:hypothetical protein